MTSERDVDKKEKRIGVIPAGIITLGTGENQRHYLLDADHLDTLAATNIKKEEIDAVTAVTGEQSHLRFPELEPEKVNFIQIEGSAISVREHRGGMGKKSKVIFTLQGRDMVSDEAHAHDIDEQHFSHLFLEPEGDDTMDFHELPRNNGDTDFLIIHHDPEDPARATIYFLANQVEVINDQLSQSKSKVDLLQFVEKIHRMMVDTAAPDFAHLPEQAKVEDAIHQALANGNLSIDGYTRTTFDNLPRDQKILGFIYRLQAQFALRGRERFDDSERKYYEHKLQRLTPFYKTKKTIWTPFKRRKDITAFGMTKWHELTFDLLQNNVRLDISPIQPEKSEVTAINWETRWTEELPLHEVGRLNYTEQNDYLANRLVHLLSFLRGHTPNTINERTTMTFWNLFEEYAAIVTTINRTRTTQNNLLHWTLDYRDFYDRLKIGNMNANILVPFLNSDSFNLTLSSKNRKEIVDHILIRWDAVLRPFRKALSDFNSLSSMSQLNVYVRGRSSGSLEVAANEMQKAITNLYKFQSETPVHDNLHPYYFSEMVLVAKTLFVFAAEYHQLKQEKRPQYVLGVWASQLNHTLKELQEKRSRI